MPTISGATNAGTMLCDQALPSPANHVMLEPLQLWGNGTSTVVSSDITICMLRGRMRPRGPYYIKEKLYAEPCNRGCGRGWWMCIFGLVKPNTLIN